MRIPPNLQKGDIVVLTAPARAVTREEMAPAIRTMEEWGLKVQVAPNLYGQHFQFSGKDSDRLADLQAAMDNPDVKAILCARGGYGTLRIVDKIDFQGIRKHPKWLIGFSDITALHAALAQHGIASIHGPMAFSWNGKTANSEAIEHLRRVLFGENVQYRAAAQFPGHTQTGTATGMLIGGNLSIISQMIGTSTKWDTDGCILFLEDLDEYLYHIDRMMVHLQRAGKLDKLRGLIVGGFTDIKDNEKPFGMNVAEIISEKIADKGIPLCFGFPTGHWPENFPLIHGAKVRLNVSHAHSELTFLQD